MRKMIFGVAAGAAMAMATPVMAAPIITFAPTQSNGATSATFSNTGIAGGTFSDMFTFTLPAGLVSSTISSVFTTDQTNNIDFTNVSLNSVPYTIVSMGQVEFRTLISSPIVNGTQQLLVTGTSGGNGSYSGTLSFVPATVAAVPEPAAWLMMILGMGAVGFTMRRRQKVTTRVSYAI